MASVETGTSQLLTSTTVSADPYLVLTLAPSTNYQFSAVINWSQVNPTDGGLSCGFTVTGTGTTTAWTNPADGSSHVSGDVINFINVSGNRTVLIGGTIAAGAAGGTITFFRGQAQVSANPTTIDAGSSLILSEITQGAFNGLQAQQIIALALQTASVPGFTAQAGQLFNSILSDLAQTYDFEPNLKTFAFTFDTSTVYQNNTAGAGPNLLPTDFLRAKNREIIYYIQGVRYVLIVQDQADYDALVQNAGWNSYPSYGFVDLNLGTPFNTTNPGQPGLMVWPPASGAFTAQLRYYSLPQNISSPETSTTVPWFPNTDYLITRLSGELMKLVDDERTAQFLGSDSEASDSAMSATSILRKYLKMKDDPEGRVNRVLLDRRFFGPQFANLRNTKNIGW